MDYCLSEEMKLLQNMTAKFAQNEVAPFTSISDEEQKYMPEINKKAAAQGVGLGQGCLDEAVRYAKERSAFGAPIGKVLLS